VIKAVMKLIDRWSFQRKPEIRTMFRAE